MSQQRHLVFTVAHCINEIVEEKAPMIKLIPIDLLILFNKLIDINTSTIHKVKHLPPTGIAWIMFSIFFY